MKLILLFSRIFFVTCLAMGISTIAAQAADETQSETTIGENTVLKPSNDRLIDPELEQLLISSPSVDAALQALKDHPNFKAYLENYVPIWKSSSLQQSFPFCPRVLMYNEDASLVLSIIDCPLYTSERDDIEVAQWNEEDEKFEYFSIHYSKDGKPIENIQLGKKNPRECMRCHTGGISIGVYDPFYFPNGAPKYWTDRLKYFTNVVAREGVHKNGRRSIPVPRYKNFFEVDDNYSKYPTLGEYLDSSRPQFGHDSPVDQFNWMLAPRNHRRTVRVMKDLLGDQYEDPTNQDVESTPSYDKLKFAMAAALSDCSNYTEMMPSYRISRDIYEGHTPEDIASFDRNIGRDSVHKHKMGVVAADKLHAIIRDRLNNGRMMKDFLSEMHSFSPYEGHYRDVQSRVVYKLYYTLLHYVHPTNREKLHPDYGKTAETTSERPMDFFDNLEEFNPDAKSLIDVKGGVETALLNINLNPIKMSWHPAWAAAYVVEEMMKDDPDFGNLEEIYEGYSRLDYLLAKSGIEPSDTSLPLFANSIGEKPSLRNKALNREAPAFLAYCDGLKAAYLKKIESKENSCESKN